MKRLFITIIMFVIVLIPLLCISTTRNFDKKSPFTAVKWEGEEPFVRFNDEWYQLEKLDGLLTQEILAYCQKEYRDKWQKRFAEDLVEVLHGMGHPPGPSVQLELRMNDKIYTYTGPMTEDNRRKVATYSRDAKATPTREKILSKEEVNEDLAALQDYIQSSFAYADYKGFDYKTAIRQLQQQTGSTTGINAFAVQVQQLLASFGDGHSRVDDFSDKLHPGYLPFAIAAVNDKILCMSPGGRALLRTGYPYLYSVNGVPADSLLQAASATVASGSSQFVRYHATARVVFIRHILDHLGLKQSDSLQVVLQNEKGKTTSLTLAISPYRHKSAPILPPARLPNYIGYLRIPQMSSSEDLVNQLRDTLQFLRHTDGLVIDIRDNPGGSRDILQALAPFFIPPYTSIVVNAAVLRTDEGKTTSADALADRDLYPESYSGFDQQDREAIAAFKKNFRPQWKFAENKYSNWHYFVLKSADGYYYYNKPVMLLVNSGCFSAADIFAAAFSKFPQTTLIGTPTGGGSGRARKHRLPHSGIEVKLSTMVSFQPDGKLFDQNGVAPAIVIKETASDLLRQTDTQLDRAIAEINKRK